MLRHRIGTAIVAIVALFGASLALAACGASDDSKSVVEGEPVKLGDVEYNVVFSRFLNPNDTEDVDYLVGQPPPPPGSTYFAVFFQVENSSDTPQRLPKSLTVTDADKQVFRSIPSKSPYALHLGSMVDAEDQLPALDSTPQQGAIQGSLVLFLLPDTVNDSRPLTLTIPGEDGAGEVSLDL